METKRCTKCGQEKPATLEFFYKNSGKQKLSWHCKACVNAGKKLRKRRSLES